MNTIFYKVIFKAFEEHEDNTFSLTFRNMINSKPIHIPSHYLATLKDLSKKDENIINFQNIQEVIKIGENGSNYIFNYYLVLLFTYFESREKQGFLIGNAKKLGDILIGIWPFNKENLNYNSNTIIEIFDNLINKNRIERISIIYS